MAEIRTHEQVLGIIGVLAHEANDDGVEDRSEYSAETRAAWLWLEETDAALRLALETAERERGEIAVCADGWMKRTVAAERERDEARQDAKRLMSLTQNWYEGRARIGSHMTFVDQRFYDSVRLQRTGWPGDDANGDGGPPEE